MRKHQPSAQARFARTLDGPPTPWIHAAWIEHGTGADGNTLSGDSRQIDVTYRLWVLRRGKSLHLETSVSSKTCPGMTRRLHHSRRGAYDMVRAGRMLLRLAKWDTNQPPGQPKAVWNSQHPEYVLRNELARSVSLQVMRYLEPKRGRPSTRVHMVDPNSPAEPRVILNTGYAASRRNRRKEMLIVAERMVGLLDPLVERFTGAPGRKGMVGFNREERERILQHIFTLQRAVRQFQMEVHADALGPGTPTPNPTGATSGRNNVLPPTIPTDTTYDFTLAEP